MDSQTKNEIKEAVMEAFSEGIGEGRYIDVSRIPLICQSINQIGKDIGEIKEHQQKSVTQDQFFPVKIAVYGFFSIVMSGFIGALLYLVLHVKT